MKKLLLVLTLVGCGGSSSEMCFPVGGGAKYCVSDAACKIQTGGEVLCAEGSDYGSILTAINEKTGEMQLCVKDKTTEKIKCFDPATECTIDGGAVSCHSGQTFVLEVVHRTSSRKERKRIRRCSRPDLCSGYGLGAEGFQ